MLGRRSLMQGAGALAALGALAGCAGASARPSDDIAFWHLLSGPDGVTMGELLEAGTSVVYPWPSFEMYPQTTGLAGATRVEVPLRPDGTHDLAAMAAAMASWLIPSLEPNPPPT